MTVNKDPGDTGIGLSSAIPRACKEATKTRRSDLLALTASIVGCLLSAVPAMAQETTGVREDCRKQADAQKLGPIERIEFVRKCLQ
jgi:hypothetical protein